MLRTLALTPVLAACACSCSANTGNWYVPPKVVKPAVVTTAPASAVVTTAPASGEFVLTSAPISTPTPTPPTLTPYEAFAWHAPTTALQHVVGVVWFNASCNTPAGIASIAAQLKALPAGERVLRRGPNGVELLNNPADPQPVPETATTQPAAPQQVPWVPAGAAAEAAFGEKFYTGLAAAGATVDYLQLDTEGNINSDTLGNNPDGALEVATIVADLRWPAVATACRVTRTDDVIGNHWPDAQQFNLALQVAEAPFCRSAFFVPLAAVFPAAHCSDYNDVILSASAAFQAPDFNGCVQPMGAPLHGDLQAPSFYGGVGNIGSPGNPGGQGADWSKPMTVLNWEVSSARAYAQGAAPVMAWLAGKTWNGSRLANSPYWDELLYHVMLSTGSTDLNLWDADTSNTQNDCATADSDLATIAGQAGNSPTLTPLTLNAVPYGSAVLVSAARCSNGWLVARVTVAATQPTTKPVSITLPGDSSPTSVNIPGGECGAWFSR